ncbi:hypothetical protein EXIGLDRAFT_721543 [Exidia glandulosa HHB12029]|uniref:Uncharacterized protein n=1 Tax=Exidia glandulosa HHB12029 TaxID=1314781 RepID=A0A165FN21_EXIGL|nr:hypothetical protein EXIGLDRAFT_721543 [Exidia glandulosa HHB12029]
MPWKVDALFLESTPAFFVSFLEYVHDNGLERARPSMYANHLYASSLLFVGERTGWRGHETGLD